jgi:uncharacterized SAM-binding protein YcdF (DUF218 family)
VTLAISTFYVLASVYAVSHGLGRLLLTGDLLPLSAGGDLPPGRTAIVALGSGSYVIHDWSGNEYSTTDPIAASRVLETVRLYRLIEPAWVISSGGKVHEGDIAPATGLAMSRLLHQLGVPLERIVTQTVSRNTHEESVAVASLLPKLEVDHLIVVTSDFHMRRTLGAFRAAGIHGIPAVVRDPFPPRSYRDWIVPSEAGLLSANLLMHEVLGVAYYAVRGWYAF